MNDAIHTGSVPGPTDRTTFYAEQRRNRRAAWPFFFLSAVSVAAMGIPFSLVVTPFFYVLFLIILGIASLAYPVPNELWTTLQSVGMAVIQVVLHTLDPKNSPAPDPAAVQLAVRGMFLPGILGLLFCWLVLRELFFSAGVGGVLLMLKARAPGDDLKEMQLVDVTEEMAVAAGVKAPRVLLLDSLAANAAIVGSSIDHSTLIVSRGLLEQLQRDELQAVVAHLVGSAGNGDLRMSMTITSVFESFGLIMTLVNAPFGPRARSTLWTMVRAVFARQQEDKERLTAQALEMLSGAADIGSGSDLEDRMAKQDKQPGPFQAARGCLLVPFGMLNFTLRFIVWVFSAALVKPAMALVWRTRRYLADATAIQLTRNPDALAGALERLSETGQVLAAAPWTSLFYIVGPEAGRAAATRLIKRMHEIHAQQGGGDLPDYSKLLNAALHRELAGGELPPEFLKQMQALRAARTAAVQEMSMQDVQQARRMAWQAGEISPRAQSDSEGGMLSFHPPLFKRLRRLQSLGASISPEEVRPRPGWLGLPIAVLLAVAAVLMMIALALSIGLSLVFMGGLLGLITMIFKLIATALH